MKVIAGLGNPGAGYVNTPHNVGFEVVDLLAARLGATWKGSSGFKALLARVHQTRGPLLLAKAQTYMNLSGTSIAPLLRYFDGAPAELAVVLDDADLPLGRLRIRASGGSGGHRGLASIIEALGTGEFVRVRLGVGREDSGDLVDHVLRKFSPDDEVTAKTMVCAAADAVECLLTEGLDEAMNRFNGWCAQSVTPADRK